MWITIRTYTLRQLVVCDNPTLKKLIKPQKKKFDLQIIFTHILNDPRLS